MSATVLETGPSADRALDYLRALREHDLGVFSEQSDQLFAPGQTGKRADRGGNDAYL